MTSSCWETYDLLQRNLGKEEAGWPKKKVPVGREWLTGPEEEEKKIEDVREGQRIVGELKIGRAHV